jgi:hypothetical protein
VSGWLFGLPDTRGEAAVDEPLWRSVGASFKSKAAERRSLAARSKSRVEEEAIEVELRILEERLTTPVAPESRADLDELLAAEFQEFGSSGRILDRAEVLDALSVPGRPRVQFEDFRATVVGTGAVLVTYLSRSISGPGWKPPALRSSLWVRRDDRWQLVFHQGTRLATELDS